MRRCRWPLRGQALLLQVQGHSLWRYDCRCRNAVRSGLSDASMRMASSRASLAPTVQAGRLPYTCGSRVCPRKGPQEHPNHKLHHSAGRSTALHLWEQGLPAKGPARTPQSQVPPQCRQVYCRTPVGAGLARERARKNTPITSSTTVQTGLLPYTCGSRACPRKARKTTPITSSTTVQAGLLPYTCGSRACPRKGPQDHPKSIFSPSHLRETRP
jgi:hypothetical protein